MEKPGWRLRASRYVVDSPYMRLRVDEIELPGRDILPNYYVRESRGFVTILALTDDAQVVLVTAVPVRLGLDPSRASVPACCDERKIRATARCASSPRRRAIAVERCELAATVLSRAGSLAGPRLRLYRVGRPQSTRTRPRTHRAPRGRAGDGGEFPRHARRRHDRRRRVDRRRLPRAGQTASFFETWSPGRGSSELNMRESNARALSKAHRDRGDRDRRARCWPSSS